MLKFDPKLCLGLLILNRFQQPNLKLRLGLKQLLRRNILYDRQQILLQNCPAKELLDFFVQFSCLQEYCQKEAQGLSRRQNSEKGLSSLL